MSAVKIERDDRNDLGNLSDFELGTKATGYKTITWKKLVAAAKRERAAGSSRAIQLEVYAKLADENGKWIGGLYQEFGYDDRAAVRYATETLKSGLGKYASIAAFYSRPFGFNTRSSYRHAGSGPITIGLVSLEAT